MAKAKKVAKKALAADTRATHAAARADDPWPVRLAGKATELADQPPLIVLSAGTIALGALLRRPALVRSGVRMLSSHLLATGAKTMLKDAVDRTRPNRALRDGHAMRKGTGTEDTSLNSFPSGHTAGAVAVAEAIAAEDARAGLPARAAALAVGALQPRRGQHYVSDVLVGAAIGWAAERLTDVAMRAVERRLPVDPEQEAAAHPS